MPKARPIVSTRPRPAPAIAVFLRFFHANAELLAPRELAERLENMLQEVSAERDAEAERARVEAERAARAEAELAKVREELERLQKERE
jgi:hypothetical protein